MITPAPDDKREHLSWKERSFRWVENQGVSTILLIAILVGVWQAWPAAISQIQTGYQRNADALSQDTARMEKTVERLLGYIERREKLNEG